MTRVDFYVLPSDDTGSRLALVCRLAEKASGQLQPVFIYSDDDTLLANLDEALWCFRPLSFIAHRLLTADEQPDQANTDPVQLSTGEPAADRRILINLGSRVPTFFSRFDRTLEVVDQSDKIRTAGRERYRFYQHRGYPLKHHRVS
ncbi:MAG: DNA polymerase III subunit chi [Granulosicoccus sp.]